MHIRLEMDNTIITLFFLVVLRIGGKGTHEIYRKNDKYFLPSMIFIVFSALFFIKAINVFGVDPIFRRQNPASNGLIRGICPEAGK